jgi:hypothetical protein
MTTMDEKSLVLVKASFSCFLEDRLRLPSVLVEEYMQNSKFTIEGGSLIIESHAIQLMKSCGFSFEDYRKYHEQIVKQVSQEIQSLSPDLKNEP